jgi:hypothetical protein
MSDEENEHSTEESEQPDEQPLSSEQPEESEGSEESAEQSDSQPADETQQSDEQSGATSTDESEQPTEESDRSDEQAGEQTADESEQSTQQADQSANETSQQSPAGGSPSETGAEQPATIGELSAKRQSMLDLIDKWMPTSLNNPRIPQGETQDLMAKSGWTKATGQNSKKVKDEGGHPVTSCGDILAAMLRLWGSNFVGAFYIRDQDSKGRSPGAKGLGYYVEADGVQSPQPGDIIVLRDGVGKATAGTIGHVGILVSAGESEWRTADGGGGALPDQTASVSTRTVRFDDNKIPILKSPTDLKEKQLDGWIDLDRLEQTA